MNTSTKLIIGQYFPGSSVFHRAHPITKIICLFFYCILVFHIKSLFTFTALIGLLWLCFTLARVPFSMIIRGLSPLCLLLAITFLIHLLTTPGKTIFEFGIINISEEGFWRAVFYSLRLICVVLGSSILTITTSSVQLTHALDRLLGPLRHVGFPSREFSLMFAISLRFIPVLMEEFEKLQMSQKARGAKLNSGSLSKRIQCLMSLMVPLFHSTLDRADSLAIAMEVRGFDPQAPRSSIHQYHFGLADLVLAGSVATGLWITITRL